jgi:HEAT repeat protein
MNGTELVDAASRLAFMRDFAYPQLREALRSEDAHTRANVIYTFQLAGDRRNIEFIRPLLEDPAVVVRYEAAATLVDMGDPSGFPTLVDGLADANIRWRFKCLEALRTVTGQDFGYKHDDDPALRQAAVSRWRGWLQEKRASAL